MTNETTAAAPRNTDEQLVGLCRDRISRWRVHSESQRSAGCDTWADCLLCCADDMQTLLKDHESNAYSALNGGGQ